MTVLSWQRGGRPGGPVVVLVHGWSRDGRADWERTGWVEGLGRAGFDVLVCDLPGHGDSSDVGLRGEPAGWAAELIAIDLARLAPGPVTVVGRMQGGMVAGHLAVRREPRVTRMVLVSCDDRVGVPGGEQLAAALRDRSARVWDAGVAELVGVARSDRRHDLETLALWVEQAAWPAAARLGALRAPVLLCAGTEDDHRQGAPRLAGLFHDARLVTVPGDHDSMLCAPELMAQVNAFLAEGVS